MPTYEYECSGCGHRFELFQRMSDKPKRKCPKCGRLRARRLLGSGAAVIFKGSGFYQTDYRSSEYNKRKKEESGAAKESSPEKSSSAEKGSSPEKSASGSPSTAGDSRD